MTILIKDYQYEEITTTSGSTAASDGYTTTDIVTDTNITWSAAENNYDWSNAPKGIYLYQESMVPLITIVNYLQGMNIAPANVARVWQTIFWQAQNDKNGYSVGAPIYTLPYGYLAFWYGIAGFGLYLFVGYDAAQPTQTVAYSDDPIMDSAISDIMEAGVQSDIDALLDILAGDTGGGLVDITMADGYLDIPDLYSDLYDQVPSTTNISSDSTTATVTTTMPAQDAYVGEATSLTYTELLTLTNAGWNSWARSINPLSLGTYIVYTIATGVTSACVGIGPKGLESDGVGKFTHSIIADRDGVKIYESGTLKSTLYNSQVELTQLRIYRMMDNSIVYVATTGTDTQVYTSLVAAPAKATPIYSYGFLFIASDKVTSATYRTGEVQYGSV
jgi:hypothetical protein